MAVHMAADPALFVAESCTWLDLANQSPLGAPPDQSGPVAELIQGQPQRLDRQLAVAFIEPGAKLGQRCLGRRRNAAFGPGQPHLLLGVRRRRGGRNQRKYKSARPNDDRSVPMERTHNHSSPILTRETPRATTINEDHRAVSE